MCHLMKPDVDRLTGNTTEFFFSCIEWKISESNCLHLGIYRMEFDFSLSAIFGGGAICMVDKNLLASRVYDR